MDVEHFKSPCQAILAMAGSNFSPSTVHIASAALRYPLIVLIHRCLHDFGDRRSLKPWAADTYAWTQLTTDEVLLFLFQQCLCFVLQKDGGCNHMFCTQCKRLFDWDCVGRSPPNNSDHTSSGNRQRHSKDPRKDWGVNG